MYDNIVVLYGLQDLAHVDYLFLLVPAACDDVVNPGKSCMAIPDGPVHVLLEGWPCISEAKKEHPLYSNRPKGVVMAVFWMSSWIWWYPFLRSILEKMVHLSALVVKSSILGGR